MMPLRGAIIPVTPLQQNCTLLWDDETRHAWVIDPGGDVPRIRKAIEELDLIVARILLTHGHVDHAGGSAELQAALSDIPIDGPGAADAFLLDDLEAQAKRLDIPHARNVRPTRFLVDGDVVELGEHRFHVLACPGHTPGHLVFVDHVGELALVGDVLFRNSVGRTDFPYGNPAALMRSIREKLMVLPDQIQFVCGHGPGSTIGAERQNNPFVQQAMKLDV